MTMWSLTYAYLDTPGGRDYYSNKMKWVEDSDGVVLMYSLDNRDSYVYASDLYTGLNIKQFPMLLVGTHVEVARPKVSILEADLAVQLKVPP